MRPTMLAALYDQPGPPDVLRLVESPRPSCPTDGVMIRVEAASLEGGDLINRAKAPPPPGGVALGYAAAGTIVEVGAGVKDREVGQRVTSWDLAGSHAQYRAVPAARTWALPDHLEADRAACIPIGFGTAHYCLFGAGELRVGRTVLVQAGAGGVGVAAVQLAHQAGATVIATVSGEARAEQLKALGLDHAIDHRREDVATAVHSLTDGRGVDLVVDPVGSTLQGSLAALAPEGRLVVVGNAGDGTLEVDLWAALQANQTISGVFMGTRLDRPEMRAAVAGLIDRVADGSLTVPIARRHALSEVAEAHRYAETTPILGRVVLIP